MRTGKIPSWLMTATLFGLLAASAPAVEDGKLLIWINGDKAYNALAELGKKFEADTGIPTTIEHPNGMETTFATAAQAGEGPDIVIWAHDRVGSWVAGGLLKPLTLTDDYKARFNAKAWEAFTFQGKIWGYPIALESVAMIFNKKLVPAPPALLKDIQGKDQILWAYDTPYFTWPFLAGGGAYVFGKNPDGSYNTQDIGVNAAGGVQALDAIGGMIKGGRMSRGVTYEVMKSQMLAGQCAMIVTGPWEWNDLKKAGIDFGVGVIPGATEAGPAKPFVGVLGAMIDSKTPNADLAESFITDYLVTLDGLRALDADKYDGPHALVESYDLQKKDNPNVEPSMRNVELGVLMPNIPETQVFWSSLQTAIQTVTSGQATAKDALDNAAKIMQAECAKK